MKKTTITLLIPGAIILFLLFGAVNTIFSQVKKESENIIFQKKELLASEAKIENFRDFEANVKKYQSDLEKIDKLFIDAAEPIGFIEFLESEASGSKISIAISPPVLKGKGNDFWPALEFAVSIKGSFPDFSEFLERLESAPYLVRVTSLHVNKNPEDKNNIIAALSIKVYAK